MPDATTEARAPIVTPFYLDKALWLVVLGPACAFLAKKLGVDLSAGQLADLMLPIATYVVMHKWKTTQLQKAQIQADAASAAVTTDTAAAAILRAPK